MRLHRHILLALLLLPLLAATGAADFTASVPSVSGCACSIVPANITVKNTGAYSEEIAFSAGTLATLGASKATLPPGKSATIGALVRVPCKPGQYTNRILLEGSIEKEAWQPITSESCLSIQVRANTQPTPLCRCSSFPYELEFENSGSFSEQLSLSADIPLAYSGPFSLEKGGKKTVPLYLQPPCSASGILTAQLKVTSGVSHLSSALPLQLTAKPECTAYNATRNDTGRAPAIRDRSLLPYAGAIAAGLLLLGIAALRMRKKQEMPPATAPEAQPGKKGYGWEPHFRERLHLQAKPEMSRVIATALFIALLAGIALLAASRLANPSAFPAAPLPQNNESNATIAEARPETVLSTIQAGNQTSPSLLQTARAATGATISLARAYWAYALAGAAILVALLILAQLTRGRKDGEPEEERMAEQPTSKRTPARTRPPRQYR